MAAIIHDQNKEPFTCNGNILCVPVIATFNISGDIKPLYFSVEGIRLKIDNIRYINSNNKEKPVFKCEVTFSDRVQEVTLTYHKRQDVWTMDKIKF